MKSWIRKCGDGLIYLGIMVFGFIIRKVSLKHVHLIGHSIANFLYERIKLRRTLVEDNLRLTFPKKTEREINQLAKQIYIEQSLNLLEILRVPLIKSKKDAECLFEYDMSLVNEECFQPNLGGVVVSAHFGNWELMAVCWAYLAKPCTVVYKSFTNRFLDNMFLQWRTGCGNEFISMNEAPTLGLKRLREGKLLALLSDQAAHRDGYYTTFLGRDASIFLGAAVFALRTKLPVILAMPVRIGIAKHRLELTKIKTEDLSFSAENIKVLAERYTRAIEGYIYKYPEQWFWLHNRWKRTPKNTAGILSKHEPINAEPFS